MRERVKVRIQGRVEQARGFADGRLRVVLSGVRVGDGERLPGGMVLTWQDAPEVPGVGRELAFTSRLYPVGGFKNPGAWDIGFYWARQGVNWRSYLRGDGGDVVVSGEPTLSGSLRRGLEGRIKELLPEGQGGAMIRALLFGDRSRLKVGTEELMRRASLAHSLALSGLHVGLVVSMGFLLASLVGLVRPEAYLRLPRSKLAVLVAAPLVAGYVWLGGAGPSLMRAGLMFVFFGILHLVSSPRSIIDSLFLAVAVILVFSPLAVFDIGLQLSASAVAGIVMLMPWVTRLARRVSPGAGWLARTGRWVVGILGVSVAANLGILPVALASFGQYAPSLYMNLVWLPLLAVVVMPLSFAGLLLGLAPGLGALASGLFFVDAAVVELFLGLLGFLRDHGALPLLATVRPGWQAMAGYYLLAAALLAMADKGGAKMAGRWAVVAAAFILLTWPLAAPGLSPERGRVSLTALDVGQGQSLVITAPSGARYLIDGGGVFSRSFDVGQSVVAAYLSQDRDPRLDGILLSHPEMDHARGLVYLAENFNVGFFGRSDFDRSVWFMDRIDEAVEGRGIALEVLEAGDRLRLGEAGDGLELTVLHPPPGFRASRINDRSLVLRLVWRGRGLALMPGDVEERGLESLLSRDADLSCEVLVLPHHGSLTSFSPKLYRAASPRLALVSAGSHNSFGFPRPEVVEALEGQGAGIFVTGESGALNVVWDAPEGPARVRVFAPEAAGPENF